MQLFSISSGATYDPTAAWIKPLEAPPAEPAEAPAEDPVAESRRVRREGAARRRAKTASGQFRGDDPATPEVNEAWEQAPEPEAAAEPEREN